MLRRSRGQDRQRLNRSQKTVERFNREKEGGDGLAFCGALICPYGIFIALIHQQASGTNAGHYGGNGFLETPSAVVSDHLWRALVAAVLAWLTSGFEVEGAASQAVVSRARASVDLFHLCRSGHTNLGKSFHSQFSRWAA